MSPRHPLRHERSRPTCHGEELPAVLAGARTTQSDLLRQAIASGQVSAAQVVAHHKAGEYRPEHGETG